MNKLKIGVLVTLLLGNTVCFAASSATTLPNGKPFQTLNTAIQQNTYAISLLNGKVSTLETQVAGINTKIDTLNTQVSNNLSSITDLLATTSALAGDLEALEAQQNDNFIKLSTEIDSIKASIVTLETSLASLKSELQTQLNALGNDLSQLDATTSANIASLQSQIANLQAQISSANSKITSLQTAQASLAAAIQGLSLRADAISARIDSLHPVMAKACDTGNDAGTASPWVVCQADANQAWVSANNGGYYHAENICKQLGYRTVSNWSGTCGNICGYCQAQTSCSNPGTGPEIENHPWTQFNGGSDAQGNKIAYTVQWRCVK